MTQTASDQAQRSMPKQDLSRLSVAIAEFQEHLPEWWWTITASGHGPIAECGPCVNGRDGQLLDSDPMELFYCDDPEGDLADALRSVMLQGMTAREKHEKGASDGG